MSRRKLFVEPENENDEFEAKETDILGLINEAIEKVYASKGIGFCSKQCQVKYRNSVLNWIKR